MKGCIGLISAGVLLICVIIHFKSHFTLNICCGFKNINNLITPRQSSLAFYPSLWTLYLSYLLLLSISIITIQQQLFNANHKVIIWIICYAIILSSCWESLFSFHRYCTLKQYMYHSHRIKTEHILKKFSVFAFIYVLSFVSQLHLFYWLFPFVILMYVVFNVYWQYQFIQMLLKQYSTLSTFDTVSASNIQDTMTRSVYIMGYCSISSTIISSLSVFSLSVFCAFDTNYIDIKFGDRMYPLVSIYFPVFWCCSAFFYMFNFVRNRAFFTSKLRNIYNVLKCFRITNSSNDTNKNASTTPTITPTNTDEPSTNKDSTNKLPIYHKAFIIERTDKTDTKEASNISCRPITKHKLKNHNFTLRSIKSDATEYGEHPSIFNLAPPASLASICDHCDDISSDDVDHDYRLSLEQSQDRLVSIRIPVLRRQSVASNTTDSSGYISSSMMSPEQKTPYILDEENEFIVPLSIIKDAQTMEDGKGITISIHRNDDNKQETGYNKENNTERSIKSTGLVILRDRMQQSRFYTDFVRNIQETHRCRPLQAVSSLSSQSTISVSSDMDVEHAIRSSDAIQNILHSTDHRKNAKSCHLDIVRMDRIQRIDTGGNTDECTGSVTDKSRAFTDMMIQCGWTDGDVLYALQRGYNE